MEVCSITGCGRPVWAIGMCSRHANRLYRTGTIKPGPRARAPLADRFWKYVDKRGPDDCWPWTARSDVRGYGYLGRGGRNAGKILSHRAAWELTFGPIPEGEGAHGTVVRHKCDNRKCCNPAHLELGTQYDNVRDMDKRGRRVSVAKYGPDHPNAVLSADQAREIRASTEPTWKLAEIYGVERHTIGRVRNRKSYASVK